MFQVINYLACCLYILASVKWISCFLIQLIAWTTESVPIKIKSQFTETLLKNCIKNILITVKANTHFAICLFIIIYDHKSYVQFCSWSWINQMWSNFLLALHHNYKLTSGRWYRITYIVTCLLSAWPSDTFLVFCYDFKVCIFHDGVVSYLFYLNIYLDFPCWFDISSRDIFTVFLLLLFRF